MTEQLLRVDLTGIKEGVFKTIYTVPAGKTFVVSAMNTTSANSMKIKIGTIVLGESSFDGDSKEFFKGLVLNAGDVIQVTHFFSGSQECISMSGSLIG